jgi:hypothetical protein
MFEPETANEKTEERSRSRLILGVGAVAALVLAVLVVLFASMRQQQESPYLDKAVRAGDQEFEKYRSKVVITPPEKQEVLAQGNLVGMVQFTVQAEISNNSDRTLTGVEVVALVLDLQDKVIAQKVGKPIPRQNPEPLRPGEKRRFSIKIDAPAKYTENDVKQVKVELHGLQFQ